jgi:hypothetical protein
MPKVLINSLVKEYSDLDLSFKIHPLYSDIVPVYGLDALRNSIKNILLTACNLIKNQAIIKANQGISKVRNLTPGPIAKKSKRLKIIINKIKHFCFIIICFRCMFV